jgi:chemotaxis protein MotB
MSQHLDQDWENPHGGGRPLRGGGDDRKRKIAIIGAGAAAILGIIVYALVVRSSRNSAEEALAKKQAENKTLSDALEVHRSKLVDFEKCQESVKTLGDVEKEKKTVEEDLGACQASVKNLRGQAADAQRMVGEFKAVTSRFQKMIDSGKLDVVFRRGNMIVKLPSAILFPSGSAKLSEEGKAAIGEVAKILKEMPNRRYTVAGHTDNVPLGPGDEFSSNWELSTSRAVRVTELLIDRGVNASRLVAAGYGPFDPIATNATGPGKQKNRRIEIILEPELKDIDVPAPKKKPVKGGGKKPAPKKAAPKK